MWQFTVFLVVVCKTAHTEQNKKFKEAMLHAITIYMYETQLCIGRCCLKLFFVLFYMCCVCVFWGNSLIVFLCSETTHAEQKVDGLKRILRMQSLFICDNHNLIKKDVV